MEEIIMGALLWIVVALVLVFVTFIIYLGSLYIKLYFLLLGSIWRTFEECMDLGYNKLFTTTALEVMYESDDLEVRLTDHSRECADCYEKMCKLLVTLELLERDEPIPHKDYVLHTFEHECYSTETAHLFESRLASHLRRRKRRTKEAEEKRDDFAPLPA